MTSACFYTKKGRFLGFMISGHSEYSEEGSDIVCAGVSAMTSLTVTCLENSGTKFSFTSDESKPQAVLKTEEFTQISENILESLYREVVSLSGEYPAYIKVEKREI
ncbi:MAG: ribosomal-processing cysteine protease Prp [Clostridia bacterium]|nr:ribosomal-processing cysteine protease Prp [Clostridia bacterium]